MIVQCATFSKLSEFSRYREKRFGYHYPYLVPVLNQFLDSRIRLQTHYPARYPTGKLVSDHLWRVFQDAINDVFFVIFFILMQKIKMFLSVCAVRIIINDNS